MRIDRAELHERGCLGEHLRAASRIPQLHEEFSHPAGEALIFGDSGHPSKLLYRQIWTLSLLSGGHVIPQMGHCLVQIAESNGEEGQGTVGTDHPRGMAKDLSARGRSGVRTRNQIAIDGVGCSSPNTRLHIGEDADRGHPALTGCTLDAVAAFEGSVKAGDGVAAIHQFKMRFGPADREPSP